MRVENGNDLVTKLPFRYWASGMKNAFALVPRLFGVYCNDHSLNEYFKKPCRKQADKTLPYHLQRPPNHSLSGANIDTMVLIP